MTASIMTSTNQTLWPLEVGQAQRLQAVRRARWIAVARGSVWLTRTGGGAAMDADVWLEAGDRHPLASGSEWVIEGWGGAAFELLEAPPQRARVGWRNALTAPARSPSPRPAACSSAG